MKKRLFAVALVCMLTLSSVSVMAKDTYSVEPPLKDSIILDGSTVDKDNHDKNTVTGGKVTIDILEDGEGYQKIEFTAKPDGSNTFYKWDITGDYDIVEGSLDSDTIILMVYGDLEMNAIFKDADGNVVTKGDKDNSTTSPTTGVATGLLILTMLGSGAVAVTSRKKFED